MSLRVAVIVDYQNMHLTARGEFTPEGTPTHESLLHPANLGVQIVKARANAKGLGTPSASLSKVSVFRGLPSNKHSPTSYRRSLAQRSEWTKDRRVEVTYRPLRYHDVDGVPTPQEKGIDVLVALNFVATVSSGDFDVVILAAHDTDLEPALEMGLESEAAQSGAVLIETAGWYKCKRIQPRSGQQRKPWHTFLSVGNYHASKDLKDYT